MKKTLILLLLSLSFLNACSESDELISNSSLSPVFLSIDSLRLSDSAITSLNVDDFLISDTLAEFTLDIQCQLLDTSIPIEGIAVSLVRNGSGEEISSGALTQIQALNDTLTINGALTVQMPRTLIGLYTLYAAAYSPSETYLGSLQRQIQIIKNNTPPTLDSVFLSSDTVDVTKEPYADILIIMARASDEDGMSDIHKVEAVYSGFPFEMYDDGKEALHGDKFTGDGIFSRGFSINSTNSSGLRTFQFRVIDNSGDTSQIQEHSFYIKSLN